MERQCSYAFDRCSLPFTCTRATASDSARDGQGCEGYDTSHDTNSGPRGAGGGRRAELSSSAGRVSPKTPFGPSAHPPFLLFFFSGRRHPGGRGRGPCENPTAPGQASVSVIAFHEKAGRSQVDSLVVLLDKVFLRRVATTVATLPSALFSERFVRSVQVGCSRFSRCCHLIIDLPSISATEVGPGD